MGEAALSHRLWWEKPAANDEAASDREYYNNHRYYDPKIGRYITADPVGLTGGINAYLYVNGNPINWVDSTGLYPDCEEFIIGTRKVSKIETESTTLFSDYGFVMRSSGELTFSPNLDLRNPRQLPIKPEIVVEVWNARQDHNQYKEYLINKVIHKIEYFCEETRTDECGNTYTYRTHGTYDKTVSDTRDLLRTYEKTDIILLNRIMNLGI